MYPLMEEVASSLTVVRSSNDINKKTSPAVEDVLHEYVKSLRWYEPDQVMRVERGTLLSAFAKSRCFSGGQAPRSVVK